jgi:hypothetical protein
MVSPIGYAAPGLPQNTGNLDRIDLPVTAIMVSGAMGPSPSFAVRFTTSATSGVRLFGGGPMRRPVRSSCTLMLLACACSSTVIGADGEPIDEAEKALLGALCDYVARCPDDAIPIDTRDRDACIQAVQFFATCQLDFSPDEYGIEQPSLIVRELAADRDALDSCQRWLEASECLDWERITDGPCSALWQSLGESLGEGDDDDSADEQQVQRLAAEGESCERDYRCTEGLFCIDFNGSPGYPSTEETDLCPVCVGPAERGEDCNAVYCRYDDDVQLACDPETKRCIDLPTSGPCIDRRCAPGFYCDAERDSCLPFGTLGQECKVSEIPCGEGLHCSIESGNCTGPEPDGAACRTRSDDYCVSGFCNSELYDGRNDLGRCGQGGLEGDTCSDNGGCRGDNCDRTLQICIDLRPDGQPCFHDYQCSRRYCDTLTQQCGRRANGQPCADDSDCQRRNCDLESGLCGLPDGQQCNRDEDCQGGTCARDGCVTRQPVNGSCSRDEECISDRCWNDTCVSRCTDDAACGPDAWCEDRTRNICLPLRDDGESCGDAENACRSGWCSTDGVCGKKPRIGDRCSGMLDCAPFGQCQNNVCVAKAGPGEPCQGYDGCIAPYVCLEGSCQKMSLQCRPAARGEQCTYFAVCEPSLFCSPFSGFTCEPRVAEGERCMLDWQCLRGLECDRGVCTPATLLKEDGQACEDSDECKSDNCDNGLCAPAGGMERCVMP